MTINIENFTSAGIVDAWLAFLDSDGYLIGSAATLANGSDSGMLEMRGINTLNLSQPAERTVYPQGNDGALGVYFFPSDTLPTGEVALGALNANLIALPVGGKVYTLNDYDIVSFGPKSSDRVYKDMVMIVNSQAQSQDSGSVGNAGFMVRVVHKCVFTPIGPGQQQNATAAEFTHQIVAKKSDKWFTGHAFTVADEGSTQQTDSLFWSPYPVTAHGYKSDASTLTFTVDKTPVAAAVAKAMLFKNGVLLTYTTDYTITVATKTVTLVAAGSAGDDFVLWYQYDPTA